MSVPNPCAEEGLENCSSEPRFGRCVGKNKIARSSTIKNARLERAGRLRRKRRSARWFGLRCSAASLILHTRIKKRVSEVHKQVHDEQQHSVKKREADGHRVVAILDAGHDEDADTGQAKNAFNHE